MKTTQSESTPATFYVAAFPGLHTIGLRRPGSGSAPNAIVYVNGVSLLSLGDDTSERFSTGTVIARAGDTFSYQGPAGIELFLFLHLDQLPE